MDFCCYKQYLDIEKEFLPLGIHCGLILGDYKPEVFKSAIVIKDLLSDCIMSDHIDAIFKISSSRSRVFNCRVVIEDIKQTVKDFPNEKSLACDDFKIPLKYYSLPGNIEVFPSGNNEDDKGHLSVFINLKPKTNDLDDVPLKVEIAIIDAKGEKTEVKEFEKNVSIFKPGRGYHQFISHNELFDVSKTLLKNGNLTLAFKFTLPQNDTVISSNDFVGERVAETKDHSGFMNKLHQGFMSDFIIVTAGQEEVPCHMTVLAANSAVFEVNQLLVLLQITQPFIAF